MITTKFTLQQDGTYTVEEIQHEPIPGFSVEEQIADKEAKLLEMYAELEALKAAQNGG